MANESQRGSVGGMTAEGGAGVGGTAADGKAGAGGHAGGTGNSSGGTANGGGDLPEGDDVNGEKWNYVDRRKHTREGKRPVGYVDSRSGTRDGYQGGYRQWNAAFRPGVDKLRNGYNFRNDGVSGQNPRQYVQANRNSGNKAGLKANSDTVKGGLGTTPKTFKETLLGKAMNIFSSWENCKRLKLYRADLGEEGSFDEAVKDCIGVFHVAASMEFGTPAIQSIENYVESNILEPAVRGTINLLESCMRAQTVKRVIFTSSISTITAKGDRGEFKMVVDESSTVSIEQVWNAKPSGWVYVLSKLMTEEKAFQFADENGIDLVSIISPTVSGPFLTPGIPSSIQVLLSPITGDPKFYPILQAVYTRLGSLPIVHIDDICNAHIYLMEKKTANGRYICATDSCTITQLIDHFLTCKTTIPNAGRFDEEFSEAIHPVISSAKLTDLGFKFKYSVKDIIRDTLSYCREYGFL